MLNQVATRTELALLLTDGRVPLAMAGDEQMKPFLESLIARTPQVMVQDSDSGREAARVPLSKNVNLWAARHATASAAASSSRAVFLGGAGALALVGLMLLLVPRQAGRSSRPTGGPDRVPGRAHAAVRDAADGPGPARDHRLTRPSAAVRTSLPHRPIAARPVRRRAPLRPA